MLVNNSDMTHGPHQPWREQKYYMFNIAAPSQLVADVNLVLLFLEKSVYVWK